MAAARTARRTLQGLFAVYKAPGVACRTVQGTVQAKLMKELNLLKGPPPRQLVRFLPRPVDGSAGKELTMTVSQVPSLADHPLVSGPALSHLKVGVGSQLDRMSSGVLVLSVGYGNKLLPDLFKARFTKTYTVRGLFGKATDDFSEMGKLIEKVTFDHIRSEQLERILCVIQGTHHKALLQYANVDLKTQEAYELAVRGLLRPTEKTPPLITGIRCLRFEPPEFELEIHCLNETQQFLRKIVHEIGLELKSAAVCTQVRRIRDGVFSVDDALLRTQWNLHSIQEAILKSRHKLRTELRKNLAPPEVWEDFEEMDPGGTLQREVETASSPENLSVK